MSKTTTPQQRIDTLKTKALTEGQQRLLKLAEHLHFGQLGHKIFDFSCFNKNEYRQDTPHQCGTLGCGIGECPIVWPETWKFDGEGQPYLKGKTNPQCSSEAFFSITHNQFNHLFIPNLQDPEEYGGKHLSSFATRYQVADNILSFLEKQLQ